MKNEEHFNTKQPEILTNTHNILLQVNAYCNAEILLLYELQAGHKK